MGLLQGQPKRMALEKRLLEEFASNNAWFRLEGWGMTKGGDVAVAFELQLPVRAFEGELVYPEYFPDVPAFIRPRKHGERWSGHQFGGSGVLCLERGPDNWHPGVTGVELIESAYRLLGTEVLREVVPEFPAVTSRHTETLGQRIRSKKFRFIVTRGFLNALGAIPTGESTALKTWTTNLGTSWVTVVTAVGGEGGARVTDVPDAVALDASKRTGWLLQVEAASAFGAVPDIASLRARLGDTWPWPENDTEGLKLLVLRDVQGALRAFMVIGSAEPVIAECEVLDFSSDQPARLPDAVAKLSGLTAAIVGLGSVGSKIAVSLARTGVKRFVLFDDDVLTPQNLVRNELDWRDVGFAKVEAVAQAIRRVAPDVALILPMHFGVATQENPQVAAIVAEGLAICNLVVDATANENAFVTLAAICKRNRIPLVWGEVFAGGTGALMARSRPGLDADALAVRGHIHGVLGTFEPMPDQKARRYGLEIEEQVLVAGDAEVSALAASMTQFALDAVGAGATSEYPVAAYLLGYKKYWVFEQPFHTIPIDCVGALRPEVPEEPLTAEEASSIADLASAMERSQSVADNGTA